MDPLAQSVERERAFVDDASHELRTPIGHHDSPLRAELLDPLSSAGRE
jgi:signal transduction histidine kinase